ncbi:malto-oligosyltrehalose synthase [candidate division KSB1 bacterium]|nr:malto-oligosyltrehalose synthase [candidate division KSB1 bacterium]NIR72235.1 malto-oligosyltrehalose synthase [candidate division KSB1 bacterium]NIS26301.1 malto-oligosyltrehalose synthase [candidate division KSB1 bacterium]NIT73064.1 malto-oligosyltrehalose synthase [candidate division KSB1 bacterium]NIU26971.1 malto-oligosyltrehalose synthase [candidate division KSB1 bacterium]
MRIPLATYRLQFNPSFGFRDVQETAQYLSELGVSDIYASPVFKARQGSQHGYDVVDPTQLNPELGSDEDFNTLVENLRKLGMGWLQDIVPNHMAYYSQNPMLMDVLENGPDSEYLDFFDVDWNHSSESIRGRILAPFLGKFYGDCLDSGEISLIYEKEGLFIKYYELRFPLKIESYATVFSNGLSKLRRSLGSEHPDFIKILGVLYSLKNLPSRQNGHERHDQVAFVKRMLWELYTKNDKVKRFIDENLDSFNGTPGVPESFNALDELLSEQYFRLSFWKVGTEELNYRRFFNINELITLRMEDERVFKNTHSLITRLAKERKFTGLRVDHVDGLYDPQQYLQRLRGTSDHVFIVVEKILEFTEELPETWPIQGTSGYDFLNYVNGLFCRRENELKFDKIYRRFADFRTPYKKLVHEKKRLIIGKHMGSDVDNLAHLTARIASQHRYGSDFTLFGLRRALVEILAYFPVYRTYVSCGQITDRERIYIHEALEKAKQTMPDLINELTFLENLLLLNFGEHVSEQEREQRLHFVQRFQQFTGPLMAKGFEDTVLYIYNRLVSLNDVGGSPDKFGVSHIEFHHFGKKRAELWPHTMNTTSTHDTKRGEDVRARINVLSELPEEWERHVRNWSKINRKRKRKLQGFGAPDTNDEYFLYQTLIGAFPFDESEYVGLAGRIKDYIIKVVREAKVHTAWLAPDTEYEEACLNFVEKILRFSESNSFIKEFLPFQRKVAHYGIFNSLSQTLLKVTSPGVPDFYQGTELWDLNLVDPDNRRPVDFEKRKTVLRQITAQAESNVLELIRDLLASKQDGRVKLFLTFKALQTRNRYLDVFQQGAYVPIETGGRFKDHILAFGRNHENKWAITVVPRFLTSLIENHQDPLGFEVWDDTHIMSPEGVTTWRNAITEMKTDGQGLLQAGDLFKHFPVVLIIGEK